MFLHNRSQPVLDCAFVALPHFFDWLNLLLLDSVEINGGEFRVVCEDFYVCFGRDPFVGNMGQNFILDSILVEHGQSQRASDLLDHGLDNFSQYCYLEL